MSKKINAFLLLAMLPLLLGLRTLPITQNKAIHNRLLRDLVGARLAQEPVKILDVGTQRGDFLKRIKEFLDKRGIEVELFGVDDYRTFGSNALNIWRMFKKDLPENYILFADVHSLSPQFDKYFDYIFINAPYSQNHLQVIEASLRLVQDDGYVVVRYHFADMEAGISRALIEQAVLKNWSVVENINEIPEGENILSRTSFLITKTRDNPIKRVQFNVIFGARLSTEISA